MFHDARTREPVVARIYMPKKLEGPSAWSCRIEVLGLESPFDADVTGVDSFQALYLAVRCLCMHLEPYEGGLRLLDGDAGDCGLPLIMPWHFGSLLKAEVYRLVQRRITEHLTSNR
jgi:hypothetical protein